MRKVFLDDLPRWGKGGKAKEGTINWKECVGIKIPFIYEELEGEIEIEEYDTKNQTLIVEYLNKKTQIKTNHFSNCKIGKIIGKKTDEFKVEIGKHFKDDTRDLIILDKEYREKEQNPNKKGVIYKRNQKYYRYKCNKCGYDNGWIEEDCLIRRNHSCSCCANRTAVLGINTIWDTNRDWVEKFGVREEDAKKYTYGSKAKINVKCPDCGKTKSIVICDIGKRKTIGCICGDGFSWGHKYIHELLTQLNLRFIDNYSPDWCRYYNKYKSKETYGEYDFFIEDMKLIIEVDGGFHRKDNKMSKQSKDESEYIDKLKDISASTHGYKVVRITYDDGEFKKNILESDLILMFNLTKINWLKCEEFAFKNIAKEVCNYWKYKHMVETTVDVSRVFNLNRSTIRDYLKKGTNLGWCKYDVDSEYNKRISKVKENNKLRCSKKVSIFQNDMLLGTFESCHELERVGYEMFGVKFNIPSISNVANGKRKSHKGYTFKYVD